MIHCCRTYNIHVDMYHIIRVGNIENAILYSLLQLPAGNITGTWYLVYITRRVYLNIVYSLYQAYYIIPAYTRYQVPDSWFGLLPAGEIAGVG